MNDVIDLLDIAAKNYPIKALANEIGKGESTLRNELTQQPGYKHGLITAILILKKTQDLRALDRIEALFDRVAFQLPRSDSEDMKPIMELVASISKEFGENIQELAKAIEDGKVTKKEARRCHNENKDLIQVCVKLQAYLEQFLK